MPCARGREATTARRREPTPASGSCIRDPGVARSLLAICLSADAKPTPASGSCSRDRSVARSLLAIYTICRKVVKTESPRQEEDKRPQLANCTRMSSLSRRQVLAAAPHVVAAGTLGKLANLAGAIAPETLRDPSENTRLWYRSPAEEWVEALPIGNGRLGGMLFGDVHHDRIQLNEGTVWAGGPHVYDNPDALGALPEIRRLIFGGKIPEAQELANHKFMSKPLGQLQYQTVGELELGFEKIEPIVSEYQR